ncbi:MAG: hypothetical protein WA777_17625 [Rhodanobacter sp.]
MFSYARITVNETPTSRDVERKLNVTGNPEYTGGSHACRVELPASNEPVLVSSPGEDGEPESISPVVQNVCLALVGVGLAIVFAACWAGVL